MSQGSAIFCLDYVFAHLLRKDSKCPSLGDGPKHLPFTPVQSINTTTSSFKRTTGRGGCPYYNLMFITLMCTRERPAFGCLPTTGRFNTMSSNAWRGTQLPSLRLACLVDRRLGLEGGKPWTPSFAPSLGMCLALNNYCEEGRGGKRRKDAIQDLQH